MIAHGVRAPGDRKAAVFTFAHLSDPHLELPPVRPFELLSKRATGYASWRWRRRHIHAGEALAASVRDLKAAAPRHVVVTGDLANISTRAEFAQARDWLHELGDPADVSLVPGNHDAYVKTGWGDTLGLWAPFMAGDGAAVPTSREGFPYVRRRGPVAFVGLNTALARLPLFATGTLGPSQIERFETIMRALADEDVCRVVLIHHPPQEGGAGRHKGLTDSAAFRAAIGRVGADLVLHGHNHRLQLGAIGSPVGPVPVVGVASTSAHPASKYGAGGYHLVSVQRDGAAWRFGIDVRRLREDLSGCDTGQTLNLLGPGA